MYPIDSFPAQNSASSPGMPAFCLPGWALMCEPAVSLRRAEAEAEAARVVEANEAHILVGQLRILAATFR